MLRRPCCLRDPSQPPQIVGLKHGISVPVNDWLYQQIQEMERNY